MAGASFVLRDMENLTQEQQDVLDAANEEQWRRPCLEVEPARSAAGSIYSTPINMLPVAQTQAYRLRSPLVADARPEADAAAWREAFCQDLHNLSSSLLKHMCSDSCFKYSEAGSPSFKICRHGFYHVVYVCEGCRCRRKGKALRPSVHVCSEAEAEFGMSGRLRPIQLTPFEVQTNYGGSIPRNLDAQDMRRVLDPSLWLPAGVRLPHIGGSCDQLGYMALYEWNGKEYEQRPSSCENDSVEEDWNDLPNAISRGINEAFCDGVNSGFYVNSYTTKAGPALAGMLEELSKGIQRLEAERQEREQAQVAETADACAAGQPAPGRRAALFGETMKTLTRLSSSYRRCHWKSAAEVIFPLLFQHLTYASHRTWKLYVKKAVFFCLEAWRRKYGDSVLRRAPAEATSSEPVIFCREGLDDLLLRGWRKVSRKDESTGEMLTLF
ncbi:unnamed protein product, partial [Effrenium voratum]